MVNSTPMSLLSLQLMPGVPVYKQVVYAARKAIVSGQLAAKDRFPSVRELSKSLKINPNTAQKVVTALINEGLLEVNPGIGTFVTNDVPDLERKREALLNRQIEELVVDAKQFAIPLQQVVVALSRSWEKLEPETNEKQPQTKEEDRR